MLVYWSVQKNYLILKMAIVGFESYFSLLNFSDPHPMIGIGKIELGKTLSSTKLI